MADAPREPAGGEERPAAGEVSAGRGVLYIAAAKMYFMVAGAAIEFALPRLLGRHLFGAYGFVAGTVSTINSVVVTGTIQAVSRFTTEDAGKAAEVRGTGIRMHLWVGLPLAIIFAVAAPLWAYLVHDSAKAVPLALSAVIVAAYAFYCVFVGSANGQRQFHKQAGLDVTSATLRAGGMVAAAVLGLGVFGVIAAWAAVALAMVLFAAMWVGLPRRPKKLDGASARPMIAFLGALAAYLIVMNLIMTADQFLLKRLSSEWFQAHPAWLDAHSAWWKESLAGGDVVTLAQAAAHEADGQVGYYRAVQNLARLPYQLMIAVTFVVFPLVSQSTFAKDVERTRSYVRTTLRYSLIFAAAMGTILAANPSPILDIPYASDFAVEGGPALTVLAMGNVAFAVFTIAATILNGAGRTSETIAVAAATLALSAGGLWVAVPRAQPGREMLLVCAVCTAGAMALGSIAFGVLLWRRFRAFLPVLTVLRVGAAVAAAMAVGHFVHLKSLALTVGEAGLCGVVFLATLVVTGELGRADVRAFAGVVKRRKS